MRRHHRQRCLARLELAGRASRLGMKSETKVSFEKVAFITRVFGQEAINTCMYGPIKLRACFFSRSETDTFEGACGGSHCGRPQRCNSALDKSTPAVRASNGSPSMMTALLLALLIRISRQLWRTSCAAPSTSFVRSPRPDRPTAHLLAWAPVRQSATCRTLPCTMPCSKQRGPRGYRKRHTLAFRCRPRRPRRRRPRQAAIFARPRSRVAARTRDQQSPALLLLAAATPALVLPPPSHHRPLLPPATTRRRAPAALTPACSRK